MKKSIKKILFFALSFLVGSVFLYSSYTKAFPIQLFEYTLVEFLHLPWLLAAVGARLFVGMEAGLGCLLLVSLFGANKWVLKVALALLSIFSIYIIYLWVRFGGEVNCGCFGDKVLLSPAASLGKNMALIAAVLVLLRYAEGLRFRRDYLVVSAISIAGLVLPFILFVVPLQQSKLSGRPPYVSDIAPLFKLSSNAVPDLRKGKHVVAFFHQGCPHCRLAAYKLHLMHQSNPALPLFMVIGGLQSDLTDFWKVTKANDVPYTRLDKDDFLNITHGIFPLILLIDNGEIAGSEDYNDLGQQFLEDWVAGKQVK